MAIMPKPGRPIKSPFRPRLAWDDFRHEHRLDVLASLGRPYGGPALSAAAPSPHVYFDDHVS